MDMPSLQEGVPEISGVLGFFSVAEVTLLVREIPGGKANDGARLHLTHSGSFPASNITHSQSQFSFHGSSPSETVPLMPAA